MRSAKNLWVMLIPFAWRLPKGIRSASDDELEFSGDVCETWTWICGGAVVLAVLAEAVISWDHPAYDSPWERWGSVLANVFVALGVAGEIAFAMMAFRRDKELKRRSDEKAAEANARASEAQRETERLKAQFAWRELGPAGKALIAALREAEPRAIQVSHLANEPESHNLAMQFIDCFNAAGWVTNEISGTYLGAVRFGAILSLPEGPSAEISESIAAAFKKADILFKHGESPNWQFAIDGNPGTGARGWPRAELYVGPKQPM